MRHFNRLTATSVWRTNPELLLALHSRFGEPLDAYVNGSQVWLRDDGPGGMTLEWRLHPVAGYIRPDGLSTHEVFSSVIYQLTSEEPGTLTPKGLWDGLECFAAYGDEIEPAVLGTAVTTALGIAADHVGLVDHRKIGDQWERSGGAVSIIEGLCLELESSVTTPEMPEIDEMPNLGTDPLDEGL